MFGAFAASLALIFASVSALKWWKRRDARRSPLHGKKLAHLPGQQLLERIGKYDEEIQFAATGMYFSIPLAALAWAVLKIDWSSVRFGGTELTFSVFALLLFLWQLRVYVTNTNQRANAQDGLVAERMTGLMLNRLIGPDCIVAHDMPCEGFNIDHVVVSPRGVYAVETKSFRKKKAAKDQGQYKVTFDGESLRFPGWVDKAAVIQARDQARWLARYLQEALARDIPVIPAVALPGWWIDKTEASKQSDVRVFSPMGKGAEILMYGTPVLDASSRALVAQAIALRYPVIPE